MLSRGGSEIREDGEDITHPLQASPEDSAEVPEATQLAAGGPTAGDALGTGLRPFGCRRANG